MAKIYSSLILLLFSNLTYAASCCGGGQSASSVMVADHLQEWTISTNYRDDLGQTNNEGQALMDGDQNKDQTFTSAIEYKKLITERSQANISVSYIQKEAKRLGKNETNSGFGDFALGSFYEALTNYSYIPLAPRIFTGIKVIIPFGENNFSSKEELRTDIRGTGFYKVDLPIVGVLDAWKFSISPQYLPSQKNLSSTYAFAFATAASYTYSVNEEIDISGTLQWSYLAKKTYQAQSLIAGQYWEVSISPSWMFTKNNSLNLNYSDSTLLGISRNSALYRSISLGMTWSELL
jgi:hypothetical protein